MDIDELFVDAPIDGRRPPHLQPVRPKHPDGTPYTDWQWECERYHGRELTGKYKHWCMSEWDGLPLDETCGIEWDLCTCEFEGYDEITSSPPPECTQPSPSPCSDKSGNGT